jgi:hypothetical protein
MSTPLNAGLGSEQAPNPTTKAANAKALKNLNQDAENRVLLNMRNFV